MDLEVPVQVSEAAVDLGEAHSQRRGGTAHG
jgi:hypothetical protein